MAAPRRALDDAPPRDHVAALQRDEAARGPRTRALHLLQRLVAPAAVATGLAVVAFVAVQWARPHSQQVTDVNATPGALGVDPTMRRDPAAPLPWSATGAASAPSATSSTNPTSVTGTARTGRSASAPSATPAPSAPETSAAPSATAMPTHSALGGRPSAPQAPGGAAATSPAATSQVSAPHSTDPDGTSTAANPSARPGQQGANRPGANGPANSRPTSPATVGVTPSTSPAAQPSRPSVVPARARIVGTQWARTSLDVWLLPAAGTRRLACLAAGDRVQVTSAVMGPWRQVAIGRATGWVLSNGLVSTHRQDTVTPPLGQPTSAPQRTSGPMAPVVPSTTPSATSSATPTPPAGSASPTPAAATSTGHTAPATGQESPAPAGAATAR